ncbi:MAG: thioredoxin family protein [Chitinophagales bacterium]|nr:thioredoxin family protein [Chitinophagales bacterium]MDW8418158.1 thioredoxin family protein [Chitinophagales bacterium]
MENILLKTPPFHFMSFDAYREYTEAIIVGRGMREGIYTDEKIIRYTLANAERMQNLMDNMIIHQKLYNALLKLKDKWIWVVITEPWCGDAAWSVPALYLMASVTNKIDYRIILRDKHPEWIQLYHTHGKASIPKLICFDVRGKESFIWGPRPRALEEEMAMWLQEGAKDFRTMVQLVHEWYARDMGNAIQIEMLGLIKKHIQQTAL